MGFEVHTESEEIDKYRQDKLHELLWWKMELQNEAGIEIKQIVEGIGGPLIAHCLRQTDTHYKSLVSKCLVPGVCDQA